MFLSGFGGSRSSALFCVNRSLKLAPASVVVPYQYTMIVWAILFGYVVFGDVPTAACSSAPPSSSRPAFTSSGASRCGARDPVPSPVAMTQPRSAALAGIGLMVLGMFLFCCNDALGKWLLGTYSVWQMLVIRSVAAMLLLAPFLWREGRAVLAAPRPGLQFVRVLLSVAESMFFFVA